MLGFVRTDSAALVSCLGDPQRSAMAHRELLRRGEHAVSAIRAGLHDGNPAVREGCCRLLDHLVDTDSMGELVAMADDPDARVRIAAFHALACDRCKGDTCAPGPDRVLEPALQHLATDPDPHVRARAAELVGKFARSDARAAAALKESRTNDPSPAVRKKAGWYAPGGPIYERTPPLRADSGNGSAHSSRRAAKAASAQSAGNRRGAAARSGDVIT
ncbi:HEAT repeat domain-containing protein [Streptomyces sp. NPDC001852]|uniref:HEAT repeat domain-containing protein n=1 Tax=Streptomyces sp. NPDC001852 TaxID=3364619 RepID=UPI0036ABA49B